MAASLVLVTGAAGFIGRFACPYLLEKGYRIRALTRGRGPWPFASHPALTRVIGDMQDAASLDAAAAGADWVVNLAAAKSDEPDSEATNVEGARNLVQACRRGGVGFIVHLSTQSAKLTRKGTYALTKEAADRAFLESGFPVTILRSSLVYGDAVSGAFGSLVKFAKLPVIPVMGPGTAPHWPIHADDLAQAIEIAARRPQTRGQIYDVGGTDRVTTNELLDSIGRIQGRSRPKVHIPLALGLLAARVFSVLPRPPFTRSNVLGSNEHVSMDVDRFVREFGFTPRRLADGLNDVLHRPAER